MSFLSFKMTHPNEGLCHPDEAQGEGDPGQDGQPGLMSIIQKRKGPELLCVLRALCFQSEMPLEVYARTDCFHLVALFWESCGAPRRRGLAGRRRLLGVGL